jgi:XTP/dITP diphosphohydrolase
MDVVLATKNAGKIREMSRILGQLEPGIRVLGLSDFPGIEPDEETGDTFEENAGIKARSICRQTGLTTIADDSGLEVAALNGRPGVHSARFSPEGTDKANNEKLLHELQGVPDEKRAAAFVCVMVACTPSGKEIAARGRWAGQIGQIPVGENGFGYDPLFFIPELGKTSAQLSAEEKNSLSHRAQALQALISRWPKLITP